MSCINWKYFWSGPERALLHYCTTMSECTTMRLRNGAGLYFLLKLVLGFTCSYPVLPNQASSLLHDCEDEEGAEEFLLSSGDEESEGEGEGEEGEMEENEFMEAEQRRFDAQLPMLVLPLYSLLSAEQQARVYQSFHLSVAVPNRC